MKAEEKAKELYPELSSKEETYLKSNVDMQIQRDAFLKGVEFAQQQKPQSSEGFSNIDMSDWHFCKVYGFREGIDKCSGCDQDKVREAAEKAFNQARKQTSILGEKDIQMTDYLISPKYKTFDDYWNSKKQ